MQNVNIMSLHHIEELLLLLIKYLSLTHLFIGVLVCMLRRDFPISHIHRHTFNLCQQQIISFNMQKLPHILFIRISSRAKRINSLNVTLNGKHMTCIYNGGWMMMMHHLTLALMVTTTCRVTNKQGRNQFKFFCNKYNDLHVNE